MIGKPSLLMMTAGTAALSIVAHAAAAVSAPAAAEPSATRMGLSIKQSMNERDKAAAERQRALDLREQAALATEERLKADLAAREEEQRQGARAGAKSSELQGEDQYDSLARIYQSMKPAKAAKVFEKLEIDVQMRVVQRMRDRSTAQILASMSPEAAARLSMALARHGAAASAAAAATMPQRPKK